MPEGGDPARPAERVAAAAGRVSVATLTSRIAGLLRESVFAALMGADRVADAFVFAFRIPNLLRDFFAEGALSSAFVPTLAQARREGGDEAGFALARKVTGTLALWSGAVALLGIVFAPALVALIAPEAPEDLFGLTTLLTRIMWPFLPLVALAAVAMGVLNSHRRYFVPAVAPAAFNVVAVVGGLALLPFGLPATEAVVAWSVLVLAGGLVQLLVQVPTLKAVGWRGGPTFDPWFEDPRIRTILRRMGPVAIGLAGTNLMLLVTTRLASQGTGWAAALAYAFRLVHLPIGLVGVAVGTVVLAAGSERRAAGDVAGLLEVQRQGLRLTWFLSLPAAVGLWVLAEPIVRLVYERGRFGAEDTLAVSEALRWYSTGVVFYAGVKAAAPQFLASGDSRTPMLCSLAGIAANLAVALAAVSSMGLGALALAVAGGAAVNYGLLRFAAQRLHGPASAPGVGFLARTFASAAVVGGAGFAASRVLPSDRAWTTGLLLLAAVALLALLYFVTASLLGIPEARALRARLRSRARG